MFRKQKTVLQKQQEDRSFHLWVQNNIKTDKEKRDFQDIKNIVGIVLFILISGILYIAINNGK